MMPRSTIKNCAKTVLKDDTPIQKDALTAITKGSSVFISYLTAHANEIALSKKRKTIMPADVFDALKAIEFERFIPDLRREHEQAEQELREKKERKKSGISEAALEPEDDNAEDLPASKRSRVDMDEMQVEREDDTMNDTLVDAEEIDEAEEDVDDAEDDEEDDVADEGEGEAENETTEDMAAGGAAIRDTGAHEPLLDDMEAENHQRDSYDEALDDGQDSD